MIRKLTLAVLALPVLAATPAMAFDTAYNTGDLILGMMGASNNIELNLGNKSLYLAPAQTNTLIGNASGLFAALSPTWYDQATILFGAAGANDAIGTGPTPPDADGDYHSTVYVTRARAATSSGGTPGFANSVAWNGIAPGDVSIAATNIIGMGTFYSVTANAPVNGTANVVNASSTGDWSDYNSTSGTSTSWSAFGPASNGAGFRFGAGTYSTGTFSGLTNVEGVVDLYRVTRFSDGGHTPGAGEFIGSFAIERDGDVWYVANLAPVPEVGNALLGALPFAGLLIRRRHRTVKA